MSHNLAWGARAGTRFVRSRNLVYNTVVLGHRHIGVVGEEFAVSSDAMEMFGVLDLETSFEGCRFAIGIRNANNKRFRLACTVGLRVFVCHNFAFRGDYTPVLAKHSPGTSRSKTRSLYRRRPDA